MEGLSQNVKKKNFQSLQMTVVYYTKQIEDLFGTFFGTFII